MAFVDDPIRQFFEGRDLPPDLEGVSGAFWSLANMVITQLPDNPERAMALRKLLESRDCAIRAKIYRAGTDV